MSVTTNPVHNAHFRADIAGFLAFWRVATFLPAIMFENDGYSH